MMIESIIRKIAPKNLRYLLKQITYPILSHNIIEGKKYTNFVKFLSQSQWWSDEKIKEWQLNKLKEIINYAYNNVPGYKQLLRESNINPKDIFKLSDIKRLPFMSKELIRDNLKEFTSKSIPQYQLNYLTTGGSSGIPFGFYNTLDNSKIENAFMHSGWLRKGWKPKNKTAILRGEFIGSKDNLYSYDNAHKTLSLSTYNLNEKTFEIFLKIIQKSKSKYLHAYPSSAAFLADLVIEFSEVGKINFEIILLGSENFYPFQREKIKKAFPHSKIFSWYGHSEKAVLAQECEKNNEYHFNPFYGYTEILDKENNEVSFGKTGEIIGTSFWNYATPFIRYKTLDYAEKGYSACSKCKRNFRLANKFIGREQEMFVLKNNQKISIAAINMHTDIFDKIKHFQFFQKIPGKIELKIIPKSKIKNHEINNIQSELLKKLGTETILKINIVDKISKTKRGKYKFLDQKIDISKLK